MTIKRSAFSKRAVRWRQAAAGLSGLGFLICVARYFAATDVWTSPESGTWSNAANWQGDITPPPSGSSALTLQFGASGTVAYTATNDFSAGFQLNQIALGGSAGTSITVDGNAATPASFAGTNPEIQINGNGNATVTNFTVPSGSNLTVGGAGGGNLTVSSLGGQGGLIVNTGSYTSTVTLSGPNTYAGATQIAQGNLAINADSSLGAGNGGLAFAPPSNGNYPELTLLGNWVSARPISMANYGLIQLNGYNATWNGALSGGSQGQLVVYGSGALTLATANPFSGYLYTYDNAILRLAGAGTIAATQISLSGTLEFDDSAQFVANRIPASTAIYLTGELAEIGNPNVAITRTLPTINFGGGYQNTFTLASAGTPGVTFDYPSLNSNGGLLLLVRGDQLAGSTAGSSHVFFGNLGSVSPGTLLPSVFADTSSAGLGSSFAAYDPVVGVRVLNPNEYVAGGLIQNPANGGAVPTNANFLGSGTVTVAGNVGAVQTLTLQPGATLALNANQTLQTTDGVLVRAGGASQISGGTINFGPGTGMVFNAGNLEINSVLQSGFGVTKAGAGVLTLDNYSGRLTVADGTVRPGTATSLAAATVTGGATLDLSGTSGAVVGGITDSQLVVGSNSVTVGALPADMRFYGGISGNGTLAIEDTGSGQALREFGSADGFTGTIALQSGQLSVLSDLTGATLSVNSGSIRAGYSTTVIDSPVVLNGTLSAIGRYSVNFVSGATLSGSGSLAVRGTGGASIQIPATYTGATIVGYGLGGDQDGFASAPGALTIGGANGSILDTSAIRLSGGTLILDNTTAFAGGAQGRVGNRTPISLQSGTLEATANSPIVVAQTVGAITGAGYSTIYLNNGGGSGLQLTAASLNRSERGDFDFIGSGLGGTPGVHFANIFFSTAPALTGGGGTGAQTSIIPYAVGTSGTFAYPVTYSPATGIVPLSLNDFVGTLSSATGSTNVMIAGSATSNTSAVVNELYLYSGASISGSGTIQPVSGQIMGYGSIANPLDFGSVEGNVIAFSTTTFSGTIAGSGGLTKAGIGTLVLSNTNTFTGTLTIDAGLISISSQAGLGPDSSPVIVNASGIGAGFALGNGMTLSRPIEVDSGFVNFTGTATVTSSISGSGGVVLGASGSSSITLSGNNNYTGPTVISNGLSIFSDSALGNGGALIFAAVSSGTGSGQAETLTLLGNWNTSRMVDVESALATLNTNGFNATLSGPLVGGRFFSGANELLTKTGAGTLNLLGNNLYGGGIVINGGSVHLGSNGVVGAVTIGANGTLTGSGTIGTATVSGSLAPGDNTGNVLTINGGLTFSATPTLVVNLNSATAYDQVDVSGAISMKSWVNLVVNLDYSPANDDSFEIVANESGSAITTGSSGGFIYNGQQLPEGGTFMDGTQEFEITYAGAGGDSVVIRAVPEPASAACFAMGALAIGASRPRKRPHLRAPNLA